MKNTLMSTIQITFSPIGLKTCYSQAVVLLLALTLCLSCNNKTPEAEVESPDPIPLTNNQVHIAFAGGGWRAHTAHTGWTLSLLDGGNKTLDDVFTNVGTISSNSGGSWFSAMLTYSNSFVSAIEAQNAINTWSSTGWLGQQQALFDAASCHDLSGYAFTACVFAMYGSATHWDSVVENIVFKDYPLGMNMTLNGTRQSWATDKSILFASTMLTSNVVLNEEGITEGYDKGYYQACLSPATPILDGYSGASCSDGTVNEVTPVTFSSIPSSSGFTAPPFLPAAGTGANPSVFNLGYSQNALVDPTTATTTLQNPIATDQVPVVLAAASSSAAAGFAASEAVSGDWQLSYTAEDTALSFQLVNSKAEFIDASGLSIQDLADQKVVRLADGGPADNSGVAQLVSFLQLNNEADGFNIVAFDNVQDLYITGGAAADVGPDIAYLFGKGLCDGTKFCSGVGCNGTCINVPELQVFDQSSLLNTPVTWSASTGAPPLVQKLIYTKYAVTTVDNSTFGTTKGSTGTLHSFTCVWSTADTEPQNKTQDGDFKAYAAMLSFINSGLQEKNGEGLKYLKDALGLSQ